MSTWVRVDVYKIVARKEGAIFKTKKLRSEWHELGKIPPNTDELQYARTLDYKFQKEKPE